MASRWVRRPGGVAASLAIVLSLGLAGCAPGPPPSTGSSPPGTAPAPVTPGLTAPGLVAPTSGVGRQPGSSETAATEGGGGTSRDPAPPAPTDRAPRSLTVLGSGDVLLHSQLWKQAQQDAQAAGGSGYDFNPLFASARPAIGAADLAVCHLETPVGPPSGPFTSYPIFSVPPQVVPALAQVGYDTCSTASNHSLDGGESGIARTLAAMDKAGVRHTGTARTQAEADRLNLLRVNGVAVALLSYTFSFNGLLRPRGKPWVANYLDADDVLAEARRARRAGAEVVIVSLHWGTEYQHVPNQLQTRLARRLLGAPEVDLILGHHAHVVQPLEQIGDKWVAYGMGNQVAWQNFSADTRDGIMPTFTFTEVSPGRFRVTRVEVRALFMWLDSRPARLYDVAAVLASPASPTALRRACEASLRRTERVLRSLGAFADGAVLVGWRAN